jgi:hypothetical protein
METEKQHLVPYSELKEILQIRDGDRPGRHDAHRIGNLTYISKDLNSFTCGVGSRRLKLGAEPEKNRTAHGMSEEILRHFRNSGLGIEGGVDPTTGDARRAYSQMCKTRLRLLQEAFRAWLDDLKAKGQAESIPGTRPELRKIRPKDEDIIGHLGLSQALEDSLTRLCDVKGIGEAKKKGSKFCRFYKVPFGQGKQQILRIHIPENPGALAIGVRTREAVVEQIIRESLPSLQPRIAGAGQRTYRIDAAEPAAPDIFSRIAILLEDMSTAAKAAAKNNKQSG